MLGLATGCYVDQTNLQSEADAPVTNYYIWLPYMLSLLFLLTKLPHILWKKFFENNLIRHLLGGEESWQELFIGPKNNGGGDGNNNDGNGKKGGDCNNKNKGNQGNKGKKFKIWKSAEIGKHFVNNHGKFTMYHCKYAFWESFNIVTILASVQITDWILNSQFWSYGWKVIRYLHVYQDRSLQLHDPMCQVFPTEVGCRIVQGGENGHVNQQNLLCILGNNIFNQKYFFALWLWWMFLLVISVLGLISRLLRISFPIFSKMLLLRKVHGSQLRGLILTSGECFVLELLLDNLTHVPAFSDAMLGEIAANMKDVSYERLKSHNYQDLAFLDFNDGRTPLLKHEEHQNSWLPESSKGNQDKQTFGNSDKEEMSKEFESLPSCNENLKSCAEAEDCHDTINEVNEVNENNKSKKKKNKKNAKVNDSQEKKMQDPKVNVTERSENNAPSSVDVESFASAPEADWF